MDHYVAYHKTDERGPYFQDARKRGDRELRFSTKNKNILVGNRLWVFTGRDSPRVYELTCSGIIQRFETSNPGNEVVFNVDYFPEPIEVTRESWFEQLMTSQANFARGLSRIDDARAIAALEAIRVQDEVGKTDRRSAERLPTE